MSAFMEQVVLVPVMRLWRSTRRSAYTLGPAPHATPSLHSPGADSDRVLLVGSGIAAGWGVLSHEMALAGNLARALSARTGRGTDLDILVDISLTVHEAAERLSSVTLERYDAVVVALGTAGSLEFAPVTQWDLAMAALLDQLLAASSFDVVIAGIPSFRAIDGYSTRLGVLAEHHSQQFNRASIQLSTRSNRIRFAGLSPALAGADGRGQVTANYRMWGTEIAETTAPLLDASRAASRHVMHDAAKSEADRQESIRRLCVLHTPPEKRFDRIVEQARIFLNAPAAALGFIDGDRLWYKSVIGTLLPEIPFADSFTQATLTQRGAVIIPDAQADCRFGNLVHVAGAPHVRFWAGFPIEDGHGVRIGTLSVFGPEPREPISAARDAAVLRQLASAIQDELRISSA